MILWHWTESTANEPLSHTPSVSWRHNPPLNQHTSNQGGYKQWGIQADIPLLSSLHPTPVILYLAPLITSYTALSTYSPRWQDGNRTSFIEIRSIFDPSKLPFCSIIFPILSLFHYIKSYPPFLLIPPPGITFYFNTLPAGISDISSMANTSIGRYTYLLVSCLLNTIHQIHVLPPYRSWWCQGMSYIWVTHICRDCTWCRAFTDFRSSSEHSDGVPQLNVCIIVLGEFWFYCIFSGSCFLRNRTSSLHHHHLPDPDYSVFFPSFSHNIIEEWGGKLDYKSAQYSHIIHPALPTTLLLRPLPISKTITSPLKSHLPNLKKG